MEKENQLELVFRDKNHKREQRLTFKILEHSTAIEWAGLLFRVLLRKQVLEKDYLLLGVPGACRAPLTIEKEIQRNLKDLMTFKELLPQSEVLSSQNTESPFYTQDDLNKLHTLFEKSMGQVDQRAPFYFKLPPRGKQLLSQLNNLIHELELSKMFVGATCGGRLNFSFLGLKPNKLTEPQGFVRHKKAGDVILHYCQLGKTPREAFDDQDQVVGQGNISPLKYITGEFDIFLGPSETLEVEEKRIKDAFQWSQEKGLPFEGDKTAFCDIVVAKSDASNPSEFEYPEFFKKTPELWSIALNFEGESVRQNFPYSSDETFEKSEKFLKESSVLRSLTHHLFGWFKSSPNIEYSRG